MTENYLVRLSRTINENWDSPALTDFYLTEDGTAQEISRGNHYTYGEMYSEMLRLGELFVALGLQKGDHIAICGANSAHWAIAYLAIAAYQGVSVTVMHSQSHEDIAHQIDYSDAKALFVDSSLWEELKNQSLPQIKHVINLEHWQILRGKDIQIPNRESRIENREVRFNHSGANVIHTIFFTSGSTGIARGVMLSHGNMLAAVQEMDRIYFKNCKSKEKRSLALLPIGHVFGLGSHVIPLICGLSVYVIGDSVSMTKIKRVVDCTQATIIFSVPFVIKIILENKSPLLGESLPLLKYCVIGGAGMTMEEEESVINAHIPLSRAYGATETAGPVCLNDAQEQKIGSVGKPVATTKICIALNGEILVKGENVMLGYYKDPEATARKIDQDGWLHTGDKGHLDEDGYLYVEGRLEQDMIVLPNGENIHPEDIERKINALPEVKESIVLARDGKLVAIVVADTDIRRHVLRTINPELPLYSQLYDVEITDVPLQKTEKQTIKRYLYK